MGGRGATSKSRFSVNQKTPVSSANEVLLIGQVKLDEAKKEYEEAMAIVEAIKAQVDEETRQYKPVAEAIWRNYAEEEISKGHITADKAFAMSEQKAKEAIKDKRKALQKIYGYSKAISQKNTKAKALAHIQAAVEKLGG